MAIIRAGMVYIYDSQGVNVIDILSVNDYYRRWQKFGRKRK